MEIRNWEDFVGVDEEGNVVQRNVVFDASSIDLAAISANLGVIEATATTTPGTLSGTERADVIQVNLTAGQTYSFDYRGAVDGVVDPYLALFGPGFTYITEDDDGGAGRGSLITYTPTVSGTYFLYATSFYTLDTGDASIDTGAYTISTWSPEADVPGTNDVATSLPTAASLGLGTYYGNLDSGTDNDYFAITVEAGQVYTFNYSGGIWGGADWDDEAGENLATLTLYNANGQQLGSNLNYESGLSYFAATDTTVYVRVQSYAGTSGGYTLDVGEVDPATRDPLESLNWDSADNIDTVLVNGVPTAYVYFGSAGEHFGERNPDGTPLTTSGWTQAQVDAVMSALLNEYTPITGINYVITTDVNQAEFRMLTVPTATYGARFYPQDPSYGSQQGIGTFNLNSGGFGALPQSLVEGGYSYAVILHEFGHAHGIAHPHDTGGGSEIMLGVSASTESYGVYNLNQGVYTVMSYNDGWDFHPDGPSAFTVRGIDNGWSGSLSAFDIAVLQERYGVHAYNEGNTVYMLTDVTDDAFYQTIWDSGGTDTIAYGGAFNAQIDLTAATLDYTPTGGGVLSFLYNPRPLAQNSTLVRGGYTIANGVLIENATGGSGNDSLLGNNAANMLTGNAGDDFLMGRGGADTLIGGAGVDTASWADSAVGVTVSVNALYNGSSSDGDQFASIERIEGSNLADTLIGGNAADTLRGLGGEDHLTGGNANDFLDGGDGNDRLEGGAGNDTLVGGTGNDRLEGGAGNDRLNGGAGNDILVGGIGNDLFVFTDAGVDTIDGYQRGEKIDLSGLGVAASAVTISGSTVTVELGAHDLTINGVRGITIADFIFAPATAAATTAAVVSTTGITSGVTSTNGAALASLFDTAGLNTLNTSIAHEYLV